MRTFFLCVSTLSTTKATFENCFTDFARKTKVSTISSIQELSRNLQICFRCVSSFRLMETTNVTAKPSTFKIKEWITLCVKLSAWKMKTAISNIKFCLRQRSPPLCELKQIKHPRKIFCERKSVGKGEESNESGNFSWHKSSKGTPAIF